MNHETITAEIEPLLDWSAAVDAIVKGHSLAKAKLADSFLYQGANTLLSRAAWIEGMGALVKTATVFPDNPASGYPAVNGSAALYSDSDGHCKAIVDFHLLTKWKTAADSLCAARYLARRDSHTITLIGAGTVAQSMYHAYRSIFPQAQFLIWARKPEQAAVFASQLERVAVATDLPSAVSQADIICTATLSKTPIVKGSWLRAGQHLDLIGAFKPDMREVDDLALQRACVFVDSRDTTLEHIGELKDPIERGVLRENDILADFYDIAAGKFKRPEDEAITICKNGGGAHLDLMIASYFLDISKSRK